MVTVVSKSWQFQAAHSNPYHEGACRAVHGHTYTVRVWARGPVEVNGPERGMVIDTAKLTAAWQRIHDRVDHTDLNDSTPCSPTTIENLAAWLLSEFAMRCPEVYRVRVYEGSTAYAEVEG